MKSAELISDAKRGSGIGALLGLTTGALDILFLLSALAFGGRGEDRFVVDVVRALVFYALAGALCGALCGVLLARLGVTRRTGITVGLWVFGTALALRSLHGSTFFGAAPDSPPTTSFFLAVAVLAASVAMFVARRAAGPWAQRIGRAATIASAFLIAAVIGAVRQGFELPALVAREVAAIETSTKSTSTSQPDLLLLTIDTLRADRLGSYGSSAALTPGLDVFARDAIVFENATAQSSWTRPSFGSIFTSRYPSDHEATWRRMNDAEGKRTSIYNRPLRADLPTLAELLDGAGYTTVAVNTNVQTSTRFGFDRGFDHFIDVSRPFSLLTSSLLCRWHALSIESACGRASSVFVEYPYLQAGEVERIFDAVADRLEQSTTPFFLWVHLMDPHVPYDPHDGGTPVGYEEIERALAASGAGDETRKLVEHAYAGAIRFTDDHAARILARMTGGARSANTVAVVTSDHGEEIVERWQPAKERAAGLELYRRGYGHGHTMYEEVLRIPLLLRLPDGHLAGARVSTPAMHVDIAPTLLALAGIRTDAAHSARFAPAGRDLVALMDAPLEASGRAVRSEATLYGAEVKQLRVGDDKIIARAADGATERYELATDPSETRNLGGDAPARFHAIERVLETWIAGLPAEPAASDATSDVAAGDADLTKQLEALGYIE